jgi:hypothetical protein
MANLIDFLFFLQKTPVPYILVVLGLIVSLVSLSEAIAWRIDVAPETMRAFLPAGILIMLLGFGWVILPEPGPVSDEPPPIATPTPLPPTFVTIIMPQETLVCSAAGATCRFSIQGVAGGVAPVEAYRVYTFVRPVEPRGSGFALQPQPARLAVDGSWEQSQAVIGSTQQPVEAGHTLVIQAVLVGDDATYNGTPLADLPPNFYLGAVGDIAGILALSEAVPLTVDR